MSHKKRVKVEICQTSSSSFFGVKNQSSSSSDTRSDIEEWIERDDHPLINDLVLKTLFGFVKPNDLIACRLVCKKWNVLTLPFTRTAFVATISDIDRQYYTTSTMDRKFNDFVQQMESNTLGIPITKFKLGSFDPTVGIGQTFLQRYGKTASKIDLWRTYEAHSIENVGLLLRSITRLESFVMPRRLSSLKREAVNKLFPGPEMPPELKCLKTLDLGVGLTVSLKEICPTFFEEFLGAAKNIAALFIDDGFIIKDDPGSLDALKILENLGRGSTLEILSMCQIKVEHLNVLKKMAVKPNGLKLKHLKVVWSRSASFSLMGDVSFLELIALLKDSLVSLYCSLVSKNHSHRIRFPRMSKLKLLNLGYDHVAPLEDFGDSFPALQHLVLNSQNQGELFIGSESCPTIQTLNIRNFSQSILSFQRIIKVCSNLSELEMKIEIDVEDIFREIWSKVPRLQKLTVYGALYTSYCLDSMFTGILPERINSDLNSKLDQLQYISPDLRRKTILRLIDECRTLPSIRNLTSLRYLSVNVYGTDSYWSKQQRHLTDVTGYLGLHSIKSLQSLYISLCKFSKDCSEILVDDLGLETWNIQSEWGEDIIRPKWNSDNDNNQNLKFPTSRFCFDYAL